MMDLFPFDYLPFLFAAILMLPMKKKTSVIFDLIVLLLCAFMAFDYFHLIQNGDEMFHRKILLAIWVMAFLGWSLKLVKDLRLPGRRG